MTEHFSADTDDLDAFAEQAADDDRQMAAVNETLARQRAQLSSLPLPYFVERSEIRAYSELRETMAENGRWVATISSSLKLWGEDVGSGRYRAPVELINAQLDKSADELLDQVADQMVASGLSPDEAKRLRTEIAHAIDSDPALSFHDAVLAGTAAYEGITVEELLRRRRAFDLYPTEVAAVVSDHYEALASQTRGNDELTVDDLRLAVDDATLSPEVRDAAYRLAADAVLFTNIDVAAQTDLSSEPLINGFRWDAADGNISHNDVAVFGAKNYQAQILLAWHPLIETANQDYDLTKADSHASADDVIAFIEDDDIPTYVRLAIYDVYADRHRLAVTEREKLEQELAFDGTNFGGGSTVLDARSIGGGRSPFAPPLRATSPPTGSTSGASGGGTAVVAAVVAQLLIVAGSRGWDYGSRARIERTGNPTFISTDPRTGFETSVDPAELAHLSPRELKAYIEHFAAYGHGLEAGTQSVEPHPYLDQFGQWRMSDSNEPAWIEPPPGQFSDTQGNLRWRETSELVSGGEPEPELATGGSGARKDGDTGDGTDNARKNNLPRAESPIWASFKPHNATTRTNGLRGKAKRFYQWDGAHSDIEVYDHRGKHLGSMEPMTGEMYKPAVATYRIDV